MKAALTITVLLPVLMILGCGSSVDFDPGDADAGPDVPVDVLDVPGDGVPDTGTDVAPDGTGDPEEDTRPDGSSPECGNGVPEAGEECDDGNDESGDGCESDCTWTCDRNWECADEDFCTSDVCQVSTHTCTHATIDCTDSDDCTVDGCDPSSGCVHERLPNWYRDGDGDGFGVATDVRCASSAPEGYVDNHEDCCDTNDDAYPGQTAWFTSPAGCSTGYYDYDYNCNGTSDRRWTTLGSCSHSGGSCVATPGWTGTYAPYCGYSGTWLESCHMDPGGTGTCVPNVTYSRAQECH